MEGRGAWFFQGKAILIEPYDGFAKPSTIKLNQLRMWIQIHDLPEVLGQKACWKGWNC